MLRHTSDGSYESCVHASLSTVPADDAKVEGGIGCLIRRFLVRVCLESKPNGAMGKLLLNGQEMVGMVKFSWVSLHELLVKPIDEAVLLQPSDIARSLVNRTQHGFGCRLMLRNFVVAITSVSQKDDVFALLTVGFPNWCLVLVATEGIVLIDNTMYADLTFLVLVFEKLLMKELFMVGVAFFRNMIDSVASGYDVVTSRRERTIVELTADYGFL